MIKKLSGFLAALLLFCCVLFHSANAQVIQPSPKQAIDKYADKLRAFEDFVRGQMENNKIPGMTLDLSRTIAFGSKASVMPIWRIKSRLKPNPHTALLPSKNP